MGEVGEVGGGGRGLDLTYMYKQQATYPDCSTGFERTGFLQSKDCSNQSHCSLFH